MKKAFSLIEVVFAIVIIAISLMSVPMLLKQSSKSDEASIIQESILASSTKMGNILSFPWDDASYDSVNKILRVLDVANGDDELDRKTSTLNKNYRKGHIVGDKRRRFFDYIFTGGLGMPPFSGVSSNSIEQFNGQTSSITIVGSSSFDYKDSALTMKAKIGYINDKTDYSQKNINFTIQPTTLSSSTNIKMIELNTTSPLLGRSFILKTFSCNIGQSGLLERTYP